MHFHVNLIHILRITFVKLCVVEQRQCYNIATKKFDGILKEFFFSFQEHHEEDFFLYIAYSDESVYGQ